MAIKTIAVFCASADGVHPEYRAQAEAFGRELGRRKIGLIYGGASVGLMQALADAAMQAGSHVVGVIPEVLAGREIAHDRISEMHITTNMHTRKALMGERADAFVILPGGFGTFEELFEVLAWQTLGIHSKPVVLLNTLRFYDGLLTFLDHCVAQGMLKPKARAVLVVVDTIEAVFQTLKLT